MVIPRYSRPAMKRIWSDEGRLARWLEVELAALEGWAEVGAVPRDAVERIREAAEWERRLEWPYRAACLDLELARALDAAGAERDAAAARGRAAAVLAPLECVHAY